MPIFPRPVSPQSALGDFWSYFKQQRSHKWPLLGLAAAFTWVIVWAFIVDANTNTMPTRNKIIYVESWDANRSDAAIILQQKIDFAKREAALVRQQKKMQGYADAFGIEWRAEEKRNTARREEAKIAINKLLEQRLAKAEAEGSDPAAQGNVAPVVKPDGVAQP